MRHRTRASVLALFLAIFPAAARAQMVAPSFEDLPRVLNVDDLVYVTDTAGVTTWGRIRQLSESSLSVVVMERDHDRGIIRTTAEQRVFSKESLAFARRSDESGREGAAIYASTWEKVLSLPHQADLTIVLDSGEKRRYRFGSANADTLRVLTAAGREETLAKRRIRQVLRRGIRDSARDGLIVGAATGAGTTALLTAVAYGVCGYHSSRCYGRPAGQALAIAAAAGAGAGAGIGWVLDKVHKGTDQVFPAPPARAVRIALTPVVGARERRLTLSIGF